MNPIQLFPIHEFESKAGMNPFYFKELAVFSFDKENGVLTWTLGKMVLTLVLQDNQYFINI